jgi:hypothetical protein
MSGEVKEEILRSFNAHQAIINEHETINSPILFLTNTRIIVASIEGITLWTVAIVIIALAGSFIGLLLRNLNLFVGGLSVGIAAGLVIGLVDYVVRLRKRGKMKKLDPDSIVEMSKKNFEIRYSLISKVAVTTSQTYSTGRWFLPFSFPEHKYVLDFLTDSSKHTLVLEPNDLQPCLNLISKFAPEAIETEQEKD